MNICKNCGVELEQDMNICPLCGQPVNSFPVQEKLQEGKNFSIPENENLRRSQKKIFREVTSIVLGLAIVINLLLNIVINKKVSWSEYPIAICLILFIYISGFTLLNTNIVFKFLTCFLLASALLVSLDKLTAGISWSVGLAIPVLFFLSFITLILISSLKHAKNQLILIIALSLSGAALFCLSVEATIDHYLSDDIKLIWSLIVCACVVPIASFLLLLHYRLKKSGKLTKTFHV